MSSPLLERQLANGLRLVARRLPEAAGVAVQMWYHVGGKDDPPARSGFAHLFEHLMFKSTRRMPAETFDRLTEDVGGQNTAFTTEDITVYLAEVPANHLQRILWAEAERLSNLNVDQLNFASERKVVQEEFRQRVLSNPYGRLWNSLSALHYTRHPYRRPVIGSIDDLNRATLADVKRFHATFYRPDNVVLAVAGAFEPAQLVAWVERYFQGIARPAAPVPRVDVAEPVRRSARRLALRGGAVPLPALALLWPGPPLTHADAPALRVAQALLSAGESSRLNEAVVYRSQLAQTAGFFADLSEQAGMLAAYAVAAGGASLAALERQMLAEVAGLADGARSSISEAEMNKVRVQLLTAEFAKRQSPAGVASSLGHAALFRRDASFADRELAELQAVTAADVQRVMQRWVRGGAPVVVHYTGSAAAAGARS
jgi:zinc protease